DPGDPAADLTGDGDDDDTVLRSFDVATATVRTLCPADVVSVAGNVVAFLRPEAAGAAANCPQGPDLNGDGDTSDRVVHLVVGDGPITNLGRAATDVAVSATTIAALVSEAAQGGIDLNGDGDATDTVLEVRGTGAGADWTNVGQAADTVAVNGTTV